MRIGGTLVLVLAFLVWQSISYSNRQQEMRNKVDPKVNKMINHGLYRLEEERRKNQIIPGFTILHDGKKSRVATPEDAEKMNNP
jgi:hypothetical protein